MGAPRSDADVAARFHGRVREITSSSFSFEPVSARRGSIRIALGASAQTVLGLILRQTMRPVAVGAVLGIAAGA